MKGHELDQYIKRHIINHIDGESYNVKTDTAEEKLAFLRDAFTREKSWEIARLGRNAAMLNWLQGLQSVFYIPWTNYDIIQLAKEMGSLPEDATEKQKEKILANYWQLMAVKTLQLIDGYRVPKDAE
jgi:hypothetical protein